MKKLVLISIFSFSSLAGVSAQGINFITDNIRQAFAQARAQRKPVFIEVYSKSCHHCAAMEPILKDKSVGDFYNQNFISYKLEVSTADVQNFLTPKRLYAPSLPLFLYFDPNENLLHFAMSQAQVAEVLKHGQTALNPTLRAANFRSRYAAGERSEGFIFDFAMYCRVICDTTLNIKLMDEYARRIAPNTYNNPSNWLVISKLLMDVDNPLAKHFISNIGSYRTKYDPKEVKLIAENLIMSSLYSSRGLQYDAQKIQQIRKYLVQIGVSAESANARTVLPEVNYYFRNRQTPKATARAEDYFNNTKAQISDYLYIIKLFNNRATDASYVSAAQKWIAKAQTLTTANSPEAQELKQEQAKINAKK
ncbi:MAG: thioredoxin family protein [Runella sp.]